MQSKVFMDTKLNKTLLMDQEKKLMPLFFCYLQRFIVSTEKLCIQ
jgi:hypothetical protein